VDFEVSAYPEFWFVDKPKTARVIKPEMPIDIELNEVISVV
jgi:hypothetical protein